MPSIILPNLVHRDTAPLELMVIGVAKDMETKKAFMAVAANANWIWGSSRNAGRLLPSRLDLVENFHPLLGAIPASAMSPISTE